MSEIKRITTPFTEEQARSLRAGDRVLISGVLLTGRDAAHKRIAETLKAGEPLPVDLRDQIIYYVGPSPAKPGAVIGAAGPTTSGRMDVYVPGFLRDLGLRGMIGKGYRSQPVRDALQEYGAVYFGAVGGLGALLSKRIQSAEVVAYEDLGPEAIYRLEVEEFPVVVVNDAYGGDAYREGTAQYEADEEEEAA
ncbi:MAG: Fe-S-containing hydro-lyase [Armatimonadetes bacterium]|nr:Fe-S-containing hydro-lyase [Armatimonadota bacterium]